MWFYLWSSRQVVNIVPEVFPSEPTAWSEIRKVTNATTFTAPEQGWFRFIAVAGSGKGGGGNFGEGSNGENVYWGGGGGGAGGIVVSKFPLEKGETAAIKFPNYTRDASFTCKGETATATGGGEGENYNTTNKSGGSGGTATGGNIANQKGRDGGRGYYTKGNSDAGGSAVTNEYEGYSTKSGKGGCRPIGDVFYTSGEEPTPRYGFVIISRGNTNLSMAQQNAYDITDNSLEIAALAQEQTGLLLSLA